MKKNTQFKRLIRKYNYLNEELGDIEEEVSDIEPHFKKAVIDNGYTFTPSGEKTPPKEEKKSKITPEIPPKYKKLFRKMVIKCHPDKIKEGENSEELIHIYDEVVTAQEEGNLGKLVILAIQLEVDVSDFEEDIKILEETCKNMEKRIHTHISSSSWHWENLKSEEEKEIFIEKYIEAALKRQVIFKK